MLVKYAGRLGSKVEALNLLPELKGPSLLPFQPLRLSPLFDRVNCTVAGTGIGTWGSESSCRVSIYQPTSISSGERII